MSTATLITADQLLRMPDDGFRYELLAGELKKIATAGWEHGMVGGRLYALLSRHVLEHQLGEVLLAETGFLLSRDPDTVPRSGHRFHPQRATGVRPARGVVLAGRA